MAEPVSPDRTGAIERDCPVWHGAHRFFVNWRSWRGSIKRCQCGRVVIEPNILGSAINV